MPSILVGNPLIKLTKIKKAIYKFLFVAAENRKRCSKDARRIGSYEATIGRSF